MRTGDWGLETEDWGLETEDWGLGTEDWRLGAHSHSVSVSHSEFDSVILTRRRECIERINDTNF